jgi:hypothetical protein
MSMYEHVISSKSIFDLVCRSSTQDGDLETGGRPRIDSVKVRAPRDIFLLIFC